MEKKKNIPELRFPEFKGEWENEILLNLSENGFSNGIFNDPNKVGKGYKIINVKDMYIGDEIDVNNLTLVDIDAKEFNNNKVEYGDIFFTRSSLVKEGIAYSNINMSDAKDLTYDGHLIRMRPNKSKVYPLFLSYNLYTTEVRKQLIKRGKTTTMTTIGQEDIANVAIALPSIKEQKRIAEFLKIVENKLIYLRKKKGLLEQYKKGVMQKIFSQEIRFKDENGKEFPKWEEKRFGEIVDNFGGTALEGYVQDDSTFKFISIGNYSIDGKYIDNKQRVSLNDKTKEKILNKNDLVMVLNDKTSTGDLIGSTILIESDNTYIYNQRSERLVCKNNICSLFLWFYLNSFFFRKEIFSISQGGTQIYVNFSSVKKLGLIIPSHPEQIKIANFLSAIDGKINSVNQQIEKTEIWKKGLLQKMFC